MHQAYRPSHGRHPVSQNSKRSIWRRKRARSGIFFIAVLLLVLTVSASLLATRHSNTEHRRRDFDKLSFQKAEETVDVDQQQEVGISSGESSESPSQVDTAWTNHLADAQSALRDQVNTGKTDLEAGEKGTVSGQVDGSGGQESSPSSQLRKDEAEDERVAAQGHQTVDGPSNAGLSPDNTARKSEGTLESDISAVGDLVEDESNESRQHLSLEERAETLPEFIWIPFADAVESEVLQGWEDEWITTGTYDPSQWGKLVEPKIDFVYLWVNGSEEDFQRTIGPWEQRSVLNDPEGKWINSHGVNRYRDWDELRYSFRSIEKNAGHFMNTIKILVNSIYADGVPVRKQTPSWLMTQDPANQERVQVVSQEEMFEADKAVCLPTFNSLTIENQMFNTESDVDQFFAMSDDMLLTGEHSPSDIYSPLFGAALSFKTNGYSATSAPTEVDARRFGEKPYLIYTSWLLNRRFGIRKRKGQSHFGHSLSRSVMREAIKAFPRPELRSACKRFRGEPGFQLYSWYVTYHYLLERHREVLLWSYIMLRSDGDRDGVLSWNERQTIASDLSAGAENAERVSFRRKMFYHVPSMLEKAGLQPPQVNTNSLWTSLDGPMAIKDADCSEFNLDECLAPGFLTDDSEASKLNPTFSSAVVFDRLARQNPRCGDCLLKALLQQVPSGLGPLLPPKETHAAEREVVVKAVMRYKYIIVDPADTLFVMVTDADQIESTLYRHYVKEQRQMPGQMCLNDDVATTDDQELKDVQSAMIELLQGLFPEPSRAEKESI